MQKVEAQGLSALRVRVACLLIAVVLGVAVWANLPYMLAEHSRLEGWKILGLWIGDFMGLLWFARFVFVHAISGEPLKAVPKGEQNQEFRFVLWVGILAIALDLFMSGYLAVEERYGYQHGQRARAEVVAVQMHRRQAADSYDLEATFNDAAGAKHQAHLRVYAWRHGFPAQLRLEVQQVLMDLGTAKGKSIPIRYDSRFPSRAWIDGLGWHDENGWYWFSIAIACVQTAVTAVFLLLLWGRTRQGQWPWWWDIYKVLPLSAEAFLMLMAVRFLSLNTPSVRGYGKGGNVKSGF